MDITKMSLTELKALKCDQLELRDQAIQNIQMINAQIQKNQNEHAARSEVALKPAPVKSKKTKTIATAPKS